MSNSPDIDDLDTPVIPRSVRAAELGEADRPGLPANVDAVAKQAAGRDRTVDDEGYKLSVGERAFCDAYLTNGHKLTKAAIAAGYAPSSADVMAGRLIRRPEVLRFIVNHSRNGLKMLLPVAVQKLGANIRSKSGYVSNEAIKALLSVTGMNEDKGSVGGTQVIINLHPKKEQVTVIEQDTASSGVPTIEG